MIRLGQTGLILGLFVCCGAAAGAGVKVVGLRCEHLANPVGVDERAPRLSWQLQSSERGQRQTAYRLLAATSAERLADGRACLWDSGRVESNQSVCVRYGGKTLTSGTRVFWKVRVWDRDGRPSAWSRTAEWSVGLLHAEDWTGRWIGWDEGAPSTENLQLADCHWIWHDEGAPAANAPIASRCFRRLVELPPGRHVERAVCDMAADNRFTLWINGKKATEGNNFKASIRSEVHHLLHPGKNVLAVDAANLGDAPNPAGLVGVIQVTLDDGKSLTISTGAGWKSSAQAEDGWRTVEFNDSHWSEAKVLGAVGMAPWRHVEIVSEDRRLPARMLRRQFQTKGPIQRATASICGLGYYELYLNGQRVGDHVLDPALSEYPKRAFYATYEVTDLLRDGDNAVGVILGNGRYFAPRLRTPTATRTFGYPKLMFQLNVVCADGAQQTIVSDARWKLTTEGPIRANNDYDGELYDARLEQDGFSELGFDDSHWQPARIVEAPGARLTAQPLPPMRVTETIRPVAVTQPAPGVFVFDMGQNIVGWCRIRVKGQAGTAIRLRHAETLNGDGMLYLDNIRGALVTDTYVLRGKGVEIYEPRFTYHGFRFVEVRGWPGAPTIDDIDGRVVHSDLPRAGSFACSHPLINRIHRNVVWGVRGNYLSIPTDCPQRDERQGWQGDRAAESRGETFLFDASTLYAKWLQDIEDSQRADGALSDVCPAYWPFYSDNVTWPSAFIIIPGTLYEQYGDLVPLQRHYPAMKRWLARMDQFVKDGITDRDQYGDWCVPPEDPKLIHSQDPKRKTSGALLATAYHYHNLVLMSGYAKLLGEEPDAVRFQHRAEQIKAAFNKRFFQPDRGCYDNGSQTSSVLPLAFGLVPARHRRAVFQHLVGNIEQTTDGHIGTGLVGGQWLNRVLTSGGRPELSYRFATHTTYPSWGYMLENDATTIWELWNGNTADPAMNSHNHVMLVGDLVIWLYEHVAGIQSDRAQPGFQHVCMRPCPVESLTHVAATHESPYGCIESEWHIADGAFHWKVVIPPNASATVRVPTSDPGGVRESGKPADDARCVELVQTDSSTATYRIGSGTYQFVAPSK